MANKLKDECFVIHRLHILKEIEESGFAYVPLRQETYRLLCQQFSQWRQYNILTDSVSTLYSNFCRLVKLTTHPGVVRVQNACQSLLKNHLKIFCVPSLKKRQTAGATLFYRYYVMIIQIQGYHGFHIVCYTMFKINKFHHESWQGTTIVTIIHDNLKFN